MPNREQRRAGVGSDKRLRVADARGDTYEILMSDISAKDEFEFMQMTQGAAGGLCDLFLKGEITLVGIAGLIWSQRRKFEKRLTVMDVLDTVNMATIETLELDDGEDDDEEPERRPPVRSATPNSDGSSGPSSPNSVPSTA